MGLLNEILSDIYYSSKNVDPILGCHDADDIEFNDFRLKGLKSLNAAGYDVLFISNHQTYFADVVAMFHFLMQV